MLFDKVCIEGIGYELPKTIISSDRLESSLSPMFKKLSLVSGCIEALTGIKERRVWPKGTKPSTIAATAGKRALEIAQWSRKQVDLIIHTGVCRDSLEPSTASVIHKLLDLSPHCMAFDISNACLGFLNGLTVAANMIQLGQIKTALVVSGENAGPLYEDTIQKLNQEPTESNFRKHLASLTLGSGGVAFLLQHIDISKNYHRLLGGVVQADHDSYELCHGNGNLHHQTMETNSPELLRKGLILSQKTWDIFKTTLNWKNSTPDHILHHQVSKVHQTKVFDLLDLDPNKSRSYMKWLGNTGTVAAPISMAINAQQECFKTGEKIAMLGIGSGLNCMMLGVQW